METTHTELTSPVTEDTVHLPAVPSGQLPSFSPSPSPPPPSSPLPPPPLLSQQTPSLSLSSSPPYWTYEEGGEEEKRREKRREGEEEVCPDPEAHRALAHLYQHIDRTYTERNKVISLVCRFALELGLNAGIGIDFANKEPGWDHVVFIDLPSGQVSWHIHESELFSFFSFLGDYLFPWDGHTTEEKYQRVLNPRLAEARQWGPRVNLFEGEEALIEDMTTKTMPTVIIGPH